MLKWKVDRHGRKEKDVDERQRLLDVSSSSLSSTELAPSQLRINKILQVRVFITVL